MLAFLIFPALAAGAAPAAKFVEVAASADTLRLLRSGGYGLYLRHGPTDNAIANRFPSVDLNDCSTQRPLTQAGQQLMARVGVSMRQAGIVIGKFKVSPMCRAQRSAAAAFPQLVPVVDVALLAGALNWVSFSNLRQDYLDTTAQQEQGSQRIADISSLNHRMAQVQIEVGEMLEKGASGQVDERQMYLFHADVVNRLAVLQASIQAIQADASAQDICYRRRAIFQTTTAFSSWPPTWPASIRWMPCAMPFLPLRPM